MHDFLKKCFNEESIIFETEKSFEWLKYENSMLIDFYLPQYNVAIECQGGQHFVPVKKFGGEKGYNIRINRDLEKNKQCFEHNLKILYIIPRRYKSYIGKTIYTEDNSIIFETKKLIKDIIEKCKN